MFKLHHQERNEIMDMEERLSKQFIPDGTLAKLNYGYTER